MAINLRGEYWKFFPVYIYRLGFTLLKMWFLLKNMRLVKFYFDVDFGKTLDYFPLVPQLLLKWIRLEEVIRIKNIL